jgi:2-O-methyltransferase
MYKIARRLAGCAKRQVHKLFSLDRFLEDCSGVIHVGANSGQERYLYAQHRLPVIWIEPLDGPFKSLLMNIRNLPEQTAIKALITDRDGDRHILHIASNEGASSSILDFNHVNAIWPDIHYVDKVEVQSLTLPTALAGTDWVACNALVLDTQGTELLILKGAEPILKHFKYIKTEAADFELYKDCATERELCGFLAARGFMLRKKEIFAKHPNGGTCSDLLFRQV